MGERTDMYYMPQARPMPPELAVERWAADRAVEQIRRRARSRTSDSSHSSDPILRLRRRFRSTVCTTRTACRILYAAISQSTISTSKFPG